jgi:LacI family transcriptional regulator/LacI family repressor for deo operon, udp, cdd, tsx, nupC, and nupG
VAEQSGYRPNPAARELLTGQSGIVGAIVPMVKNVFFMDLFNDLAKRLRERKLRLQLAPVETKEEFLAVLDEFAARRLRMALVVPPEDGITVPRLVSACLPVVSMVSPCREGKGIHFLAPDEEALGRAAVGYLHRRGHRRILHLTYLRQSYAIKARAEGYEKQMREMGLAPYTLAGVDRDSLARAMETHRPTALFCHNDWLALTVLLLLSELGLRVPEDVSVLGVDNSPTLVAINPRLTTLPYPVESLGRAVLGILDGKPGSLKDAEFPIMERETVRSL